MGCQKDAERATVTIGISSPWVFEKHTTIHETDERRLLKDEPHERTLWLTALKNLNTANPGEAARQIGPDTVSSSADVISRSLIQQSGKSALSTLLALLALPHTRNFEQTVDERGRRTSVSGSSL